MARKTKLKLRLIAVSVLVLTAVAFLTPEHAETVAKGFMLLIGAAD